MLNVTTRRHPTSMHKVNWPCGPMSHTHLQHLGRVLTLTARRELRGLQHLERETRLREARLQTVLEAADPAEI